MDITFNTKAESNKLQQDEFLKLSKVERIYRFLELMLIINKYPTKHKNNKNNNFVIEIKRNDKNLGK